MRISKLIKTIDKKKFKYLFYPLLVITFSLILGLLKINGTSVGMYNLILSGSYQNDENLLFGKPQLIRSDQYIVAIPLLSSQEFNMDRTINPRIGEGTNLGIGGFASRNIFAIFRPSSIPALFSDDIEITYSIFWWLEQSLLLISTYLLLMYLTRNNQFISTVGSLLFLATPFTQWWNNTNIITWISFGLFFFFKIIEQDNWKKSFPYAIGLAYSIISYILLLYPPFQIVVAYVAIALTMGIILNKKTIVLKKLKWLIPLMILVLLVASSFVFGFYNEFHDVIEKTINTTYPGQRFITAGEGNRHYLFGSFYNFLLQDKDNLPPVGNQCETSNFFLLFPPLIMWVLYKNITFLRLKKPLDWVPIFLSLIILFYLAWYYLPLPDFISKYTLLSNVPSKRLGIGFGFASYILMFYLLSKDIYKVQKKKVFELLLASGLAIAFGLLTYKFGYILYEVSPTYFNYPEIVNYQGKILLVSLFSSIIIFLLLFQYKKTFLFLLLIWGILSTFYVNPIYRGLDILINTPLADYITELTNEDDSPWIAYQDHYLAQYALANGAHVINGVHFYPQFEIWEVIDPEEEYIDVYNRFAHVIVNEYEEDEELVRVIHQDAIEVNIDPCDNRLKELGVKYIISRNRMENSCLTSLREFPEYIVFIYQID